MVLTAVAKKAGTAVPSVGRYAIRRIAYPPSPGRAQNLLAGCIFDRFACQKCFCVTFGESNKAYVPYPALIAPDREKGQID
ncbi:MAG: hypothetical protein HDR88_01355 [Bacteroides sp.]|nr:hypothetical protein [Bacteroides sp.]